MARRQAAVDPEIGAGDPRGALAVRDRAGSAHQTHLATPERSWVRISQVVVNDLAETERQVGYDMNSRHHLKDRQVRDRRQCMRQQMERRGAGPGSLYRNILEVIFDQFADAWRPIDVR